MPPESEWTPVVVPHQPSLIEFATRWCKTHEEWHPVDAFTKRGECRKANAEATKRWRDANLEKHRRTIYSINLRRYGLTIEEYEAMLEAQGGVCAVCGAPPGARRLHVDHDHATGAVRAILCSGCNQALGAINDSPERLRLLIEYLARFDGMGMEL